MARTKKTKKESVYTKAEEKAKNIQLIINVYQDSDSNLSMSAAARIFNYFKDFISNHINLYGEYGFLPNYYVESQKLSPPENLALIVYISDCYNAGLPFNPKFLRTFANNIIEMKGSIQWVEKNWHQKFYKRHSEVETRFARLMQKQRVLNENAGAYIEWFQLYEKTIAKWGILLEDIWNMDEPGAVMGQKHYTRVVVSALEKDAISSTDKSREWGTFIEIINAIGKALKVFFVMKGESVFEDYEKFIEKSGHTVA